MMKMIKHHRGRASLKVRTLKYSSSSSESEPEGEKSDELASLEAPDDEGGRCWPKRSRVTRW